MRRIDLFHCNLKVIKNSSLSLSQTYIYNNSEPMIETSLLICDFVDV
jgi:hypothetical protein